MHSTASSQATNAQIAWERVRSLEPLVIAHRREGDLVRRLPDAVARAFLDLDMYRLLVPEDLGGLGIDPFTFFDLCIELSAYDGSVGWNFGIGAGSISVIGSFPLERLRAIFGSPDCGIAGSIFPPGKATQVAGGYKFTGRWAWASGIHNARWVNGLAIVYDGDAMLIEDGEPVVIKAQFARDDVRIEDSWHVGGMKGTGSTEFSLTDHFVRDEDTFEPFTAASHPDPIFALPVSFLGMPLCAVAIGVATGTSRAFKAFLLDSKSGSKEQGYAQYALAKAEAICEIRAALCERSLPADLGQCRRGPADNDGTTRESPSRICAGDGAVGRSRGPLLPRRRWVGRVRQQRLSSQSERRSRGQHASTIAAQDDGEMRAGKPGLARDRSIILVTCLFGLKPRASVRSVPFSRLPTVRRPPPLIRLAAAVGRTGRWIDCPTCRQNASLHCLMNGRRCRAARECRLRRRQRVLLRISAMLSIPEWRLSKEQSRIQPRGHRQRVL